MARTEEEINRVNWDYQSSLRENGGAGATGFDPNPYNPDNRGLTVPDTRQVNPVGDAYQGAMTPGIGRMTTTPIPANQALNISAPSSYLDKRRAAARSSVANRKEAYDKAGLFGSDGVFDAMTPDAGKMGDSISTGIRQLYNKGGKIALGKGYEPVSEKPFGGKTGGNVGAANTKTGKTKTKKDKATEDEAAVMALKPPALIESSTYIGGNMNQNVAPTGYETGNYRDAFTYGEGDNQGVQFGGDTGRVSGLNPEQAKRIQSSLSQGKQVSGFNTDQMVQGMRGDTNGEIMEALYRGDIDSNRAAALMNRDFRAADRYDRRGGNMQDYIKPDAAPTTVEQAMAFGQNFNNFYLNGEVNPEMAYQQQQNYIDQLGGLRGLGANADGDYKSYTEDTFSSDGAQTGQKTTLYSGRTGETEKAKKLSEDEQNVQTIQQRLKADPNDKRALAALAAGIKENPTAYKSLYATHFGER